MKKGHALYVGKIALVTALYGAGGLLAVQGTRALDRIGEEMTQSYSSMQQGLASIEQKLAVLEKKTPLQRFQTLDNRLGNWLAEKQEVVEVPPALQYEPVFAPYESWILAGSLVLGLLAGMLSVGGKIVSKK